MARHGAWLAPHGWCYTWLDWKQSSDIRQSHRTGMSCKMQSEKHWDQGCHRLHSSGKTWPDTACVASRNWERGPRTLNQRTSEECLSGNLQTARACGRPPRALGWTARRWLGQLERRAPNSYSTQDSYTWRTWWHAEKRSSGALGTWVFKCFGSVRHRASARWGWPPRQATVFCHGPARAWK